MIIWRGIVQKNWRLSFASAGRALGTLLVVECKGGANLDDGQILSMNFYVKGVDDKIPGK
jgi:hypothetical protein